MVWRAEQRGMAECQQSVPIGRDPARCMLNAACLLDAGGHALHGKRTQRLHGSYRVMDMAGGISHVNMP